MGRTGRLTAAIGLCLALPAPGAAASLAALAPLRPGLWQVRALDGSRPATRICLADPTLLAQIRHRGVTCTRMAIADAPREAVVHYSCPGAGWGRTTVRVDRADAARIETQGIADNAPFAFVADARRIGDCPAGTPPSAVR